MYRPTAHGLHTAPAFGAYRPAAHSTQRLFLLSYSSPASQDSQTTRGAVMLIVNRSLSMAHFVHASEAPLET